MRRAMISSAKSKKRKGFYGRLISPDDLSLQFMGHKKPAPFKTRVFIINSEKCSLHMLVDLLFEGGLWRGAYLFVYDLTVFNK